MSPNDPMALPDLDALDGAPPTNLNAHQTATNASFTEADLDPVLDVPITLTAILGRTQLSVADVLRMNAGSIIELDRAIGEPIDIYINSRLVARGEVVLIEDRLGITMSEIIPTTA